MEIFEKLFKLLINILVVITVIIIIILIVSKANTKRKDMNYYNLFGYTALEKNNEKKHNQNEIVIININNYMEKGNTILYIENEIIKYGKIESIGDEFVNLDDSNNKNNKISKKQIVGEVVYTSNQLGPVGEMFTNLKILVLIMIILIIADLEVYFLKKYNKEKREIIDTTKTDIDKYLELENEQENIEEKSYKEEEDLLKTQIISLEEINSSIIEIIKDKYQENSNIILEEKQKNNKSEKKEENIEEFENEIIENLEEEIEFLEAAETDKEEIL